MSTTTSEYCVRVGMFRSKVMCVKLLHRKKKYTPGWLYVEPLNGISFAEKVERQKVAPNYSVKKSEVTMLSNVIYVSG